LSKYCTQNTFCRKCSAEIYTFDPISPGCKDGRRTEKEGDGEFGRERTAETEALEMCDSRKLLGDWATESSWATESAEGDGVLLYNCVLATR